MSGLAMTRRRLHYTVDVQPIHFSLSENFILNCYAWQYLGPTGWGDHECSSLNFLDGMPCIRR
jgi:hypothetical protein